MNRFTPLPQLSARAIEDTVRENIAQRGYSVLYHDGMDCPGCGFSAWHIGRHSAECARCHTALAFAHGQGAL